MIIGGHTIKRIRSFFNDPSIQLNDLICAECRAKSQLRKINGEPKVEKLVLILRVLTEVTSILIVHLKKLMTSSVKRINQKRFKQKMLQGLVKKLNFMLHHFQKLIV